jgi:hypothetical protein
MLYSSINAVDDIEDFFQNNWDFAVKHKANELLNSLINVQFALQDLMFKISDNYRNIGLSNYDVLLNEAYKYAAGMKEDVLFVTFNYDLLIEFSIRKLYPDNFRYLAIEDYIKYPLKVIKLHGSCNWFRKFKEGFSLNNKIFPHYSELFRRKYTLQQIEENLEKELVIAGGSQFPGPLNTTEYGFPQLLIPFKSKDSFILPDSHRQYLENNISKVDSILIIGWKGYEETFLNFLKENLSEKILEIESVNCSNPIVEEHIKRYLPKANFYNYAGEHQISKFNSRSNQDFDNGFDNIYHGSFSAYTLQTIKKLQQSFFTL